MPEEKMPDLVEGLFPAGGIAAVAGEHASGKSMLLTHLAMCIGTGRAFFSYPVTSGVVILYAPDVQKKRFRAWSVLNSPSESPPTVVHIRERCQMEGVVDICEQIQVQTDLPIRAIILDSLIGDTENTEAAGVISALNEQMQASVFFAMDQPAGGMGRRGHSSLYAIADTVLEIRGIGDGARAVNAAKRKDEMQGKDLFTFTVKSVETSPGTANERPRRAGAVLELSSAKGPRF